MLSRSLVFWVVDAQADFMLPGGKLYVPGAEKLLPNIRKLTDAARRGHVFLVSHGCYHTQDDPEFSTFPPHCIKGTPGADFVPEASPSAWSPFPTKPRLRCRRIFRNINRLFSRSRRSTSFKASTRTRWLSNWIVTPNSSSSVWLRNTAFALRPRDCSSADGAFQWFRMRSKL